MANGNVLERYQPYTPATPGDYPGSAPTINKEALDSAASMINYANARQVFVDAVSGSDATGTGAQLRPYQSIQAALAAIALLPVGDYVLELAPGDYGGAPIAWPTAGYNVSINGSGTSCSISAAITFTSAALDNNQVVWQGVGLTASPPVFDLALASIATIIINNCGVGLSRIDTLPAGPQSIRIWNSIITSISTDSAIIMENCHWVGGPANIIGATGTLIVQASLCAAMQYDIAAGGQMIVDGSLASFSTFNVDGTLVMLSSVTSGATVAGTGTLNADAASLGFSPTLTVATVALADQSQYVGYTPANPGDWSVVPAEVKAALDELASGNTAGVRIEMRTVSAPEAAAKALTLAQTPKTDAEVDVVFLGVGQFNGTDFAVTGTTLDWTGLGMDTIGVVAGDTMVITYAT